MRIVDIRERSANFRSRICDAYIDLTGVTVSLVPVMAEKSYGRRFVA